MRLGDVAAINPESLGQRTSPDYAFGYIDISQIDEPGVCVGWTPTTFATAPSRARRAVRENDIIVSTVRPYLRAFAMVPLSDEPLVASTGFAVVRAHDGVDQDFLFQHVMAAGFIEHLKPRMTGSNYPAVSADDVSEYEFSCPPLDEQRRIAEVLRSIDGAVSAARALREQSLCVKQLLIDDLCHGAGEDRLLNEDDLPSGWRLVSLGDVLESVRYGTSAKCDATAQEGLPVLRIPNVVGGRVDLDDLKFASVAKADERRFSLRNGDILLVRTNGNPAYVGRNAFVTNVSSSLLFASYLIRLRCDHEAVSAAYIHAAFNSTRIRSGLLRSATTSAGNYNINTESLRALTIPLPSLPEQRMIADEIASASVTFDRYEHDLWAKKTLREHLAQELLSGRVRVPA